MLATFLAAAQHPLFSLPRPLKVGKIMAQNLRKAIVLHTPGVPGDQNSPKTLYSTYGLWAQKP